MRCRKSAGRTRTSRAGAPAGSWCWIPRGSGADTTLKRMAQFADLGLSEPLLEALRHLGYERPTPIQEQTIPALLEGRDVMGQAQTGTGKTAAFGLPMLQYVDPRNSA